MSRTTHKSEPVADAPTEKSVGAVAREPKPLPRFEDTGPEVPTFAAYFETHIEEIKAVQRVMEEPLSDDGVVLIHQLTHAESYHTKARSMLAWANSYLDLAERQRLVPYDRGSYTDTDRQTELAAACARERRFRDVIEGLVKGIEQRISLGQSLLRFHEENLKRGA